MTLQKMLFAHRGFEFADGKFQQFKLLLIPLSAMCNTKDNKLFFHDKI